MSSTKSVCIFWATEPSLSSLLRSLSSLDGRQYLCAEHATAFPACRAPAYATICRSRPGNGAKGGTAADAGVLRPTVYPVQAPSTFPRQDWRYFRQAEYGPRSRRRRGVFAGATALYVYAGG